MCKFGNYCSRTFSHPVLWLTFPLELCQWFRTFFYSRNSLVSCEGVIKFSRTPNDDYHVHRTRLGTTELCHSTVSSSVVNCLAFYLHSFRNRVHQHAWLQSWVWVFPAKPPNALDDTGSGEDMCPDSSAKKWIKLCLHEKLHETVSQSSKAMT